MILRKEISIECPDKNNIDKYIQCKRSVTLYNVSYNVYEYFLDVLRDYKLFLEETKKK